MAQSNQDTIELPILTTIFPNTNSDDELSEEGYYINIDSNNNLVY